MFNIFKKKELSVMGPIKGKVIDITEVPDKVFSEKMIGDGVAIVPEDGLVVSPIEGEVVTVFPTNHAIGLRSKNGIELLIHIGLDTVELNGEGFKRITSEGARVKVGDQLMEFDMDYIRNAGKELVTPIIVTNMDQVSSMDKKLGEVEGSDQDLMTIKLK